MIIKSTDEYLVCINELHNKDILYFNFDMSVIVIVDIKFKKHYIIGINHIEYEIEFNMDDFKFNNVIYYKYNNVSNNNIYDLNSYFFYYFGTELDIDSLFRDDIMFYGEYCFSLLPLTIIYNKIHDLLFDYTLYDITDDFMLYHDNTINVCNYINQCGILYDENIIYSNMKYKNITGRPSNTTDNINLLAISKKNGDRSKIKSIFDNGVLIQFDYISFHMKIISDLIGYSYNYNDNIHYNLAVDYYGRDNITNDEYEFIKRNNFKILYGDHGIDNDFTRKMDVFIKEMYVSFTMKGYIETFFFKRRIYIEQIENPNPKKVFNYYIQSFESEHNLLVMNKIIELLKNKQSKLILYTYDSFLFDYNLDDGEELLVDIHDDISTIYKSTIQSGNDYQNLHFLN